MFLAHSFRLRDPWQCEALEDGGLRWSRVFHLPTGLEDDDALWLVCSGLPAGAHVTVNGEPLTADGHDGPYQFDVTAILIAANRIELQIPAGAPPLPPQAASLKPQAFPYDLRLGVLGLS